MMHLKTFEKEEKYISFWANFHVVFHSEFEDALNYKVVARELSFFHIFFFIIVEAMSDFIWIF